MGELPPRFSPRAYALSTAGLVTYCFHSPFRKFFVFNIPGFELLAHPSNLILRFLCINRDAPLRQFQKSLWMPLHRLFGLRSPIGVNPILRTRLAFGLPFHHVLTQRRTYVVGQVLPFCPIGHGLAPKVSHRFRLG